MVLSEKQKIYYSYIVQYLLYQYTHFCFAFAFIVLNCS